MGGSFQRLKQKMQDLLLGGEETDKESNSTAAPSPQHQKKSRQHAQIYKDTESNAKVVHYYPKKGNFRFPLDVGESKEPAHQPVQKTEEKPRETTFYDSSFTNNEQADKKTERQSTTERKEQNSVSSVERQNYFQGNDFSSEEIPSPVFGFERVPLHPDFLKKRNHTVLPVTESREMESEEEESTASEEIRLESELEKQEPPQSTENEIDDRMESTFYSEQTVDISIPSAAGDTSQPYSSNSEVVDQTQVETVNKETESVDTEAKAESQRLSRQERRRQRRESREKNEEKTQESSQKSSQSTVPFNVLMYENAHHSQTKRGKKSASTTYEFPGIHLLNVPPKAEENDSEELQQQKQQLENTLHNFNVDAKVIDVTKGPSVTRYEVQPAAGVKVNKITNLTDDMKLALAAKDLRMEAPIPGKNAIGIEVPNPVSKPVFLREILRRDVFTRSDSPLTVAMGLDISGSPIVADLQKMPHGLIAGATGSGKSVCINSILLSILYKSNPEEVKLMLIDPKMVELASYKEIPHLVTPVINDAKEATAGLKWAVAEMEERYERLAHEGVRDITKYNERVQQKGTPEKKMPYIVIIIDELADLMMVSPQDVEDAVCRIAQKARACGIHLLLATQRPSVDVITGLIKANIPSRTAFAVSSQVDSRTILDMGGAERLIGKGDMLFHENTSPKPLRVQGTFVSDEEIDAVTEFVKSQKAPAYMFQREELAKKVDQQESGDALFPEACHFVTEQGSASSSLLQRHFSIGYNRAAKLIDMMEKKGIISGPRGSKPRQVLMSQNEIEEQQLM
ncbi:S-DNA-T family DNA segregation ATPase FtsK/SpoIIIE [Salibacterium salarium]|uniref:DNA translocase FtsK n=1 Tax=Salibacterium salarium TaxID=284579 RepID=UPI002783637B|nr:DNA translocase FtsK [Salibacterium salarium]MDQ0298532.1 S-DNA-T family DNA segregation ATPase FtsK/SpoIIIE [Salibacterium salarium]